MPFAGSAIDATLSEYLMIRLASWLACALIGLIARAPVHATGMQTSLHLGYRLSPAIQSGQLQGLTVTAVFDLPADGTLRWKPPRGIAARHPSAFVSTPTVQGASFGRAADGSWIVRGKKGARATMTYLVHPVPREKNGMDGLYEGIWVGGDQFEALGNDVFATPISQDRITPTLDWSAPDGWSLATPSSTFRPAAMTVAHLVQSSFVGGRGMSEVRRAIHGGTLRVASVGAPVRLDALADAMVPVIDGLRDFWGDTTGDFVVTLQATAPGSPRLIGIGRDGGFMGKMKADLTPRDLAGLATHEYTHAWIPSRTGRMPEGAREPSAYWFSEGFTVFYTSRMELHDGRISLQTFQDRFNALSVGYDMSPVRRAPNRRIEQDFWNHPEVEQLPYDRGAMLAYLLDARLLDRTQGKRSLDDVVRHMRDRFGHEPALGVRDNLVSSYADMGGGDIRDWLRRYIDRGEQMVLPDDLFGGCLTVLREHKPGIGLVQSAQLDSRLSPSRRAACLQRLGGR